MSVFPKKTLLSASVSVALMSLPGAIYAETAPKKIVKRTAATAVTSTQDANVSQLTPLSGDTLKNAGIAKPMAIDIPIEPPEPGNQIIVIVDSTGTAIDFEIVPAGPTYDPTTPTIVIKPPEGQAIEVPVIFSGGAPAEQILENIPEGALITFTPEPPPPPPTPVDIVSPGGIPPN